MKPALLLSVIIPALTLFAQESSFHAADAVENLVHDYCGTDPAIRWKAEDEAREKAGLPVYLRGAPDPQKNPYLRCREMVVAKALDAHFVAMNKENERLRRALRSVCALPDKRQTVKQACAALEHGD